MAEGPWGPLADRVGPRALRAAKRADLSALLAVERACHGSPWPEEVFAREFDVPFSFLWAVEGLEGEPELVGLLVFWRVHDELHILDLAVHPAARRQGVGRGLLAALEALGRARRMLLITLEVRASNRIAQALYRQAAYAQVATCEAYYRDNQEDAMIMLRALEDLEVRPFSSE